MAKKRTTKSADAPEPSAESSQAQPSGQPPLGVAQSEIGPITFGEGGVVTYHGADDPETKAAYHAGHPAESAIPTMPGNQARPAPDAAADEAASRAAKSAAGEEPTGARTRTAARAAGAERVAPPARSRKAAAPRKAAPRKSRR